MSGAALTTPAGRATAAHSAFLKSIIVPLDGSSFSERALPYAIDMAPKPAEARHESLAAIKAG